MGKSYGERLEAACEKALSIYAISYKDVESILKNNLDQSSVLQSTEESHTTELKHDNVRGEEYFNQQEEKAC